MRSLDNAFRKEKIKHSQGDIRRALGEIAKVSGGTVERDKNKEVIGIYEMSVDTKTLGQAVLGDYEAYGDDKAAQAAVSRRNFAGVTEAVRNSPGEFKVYPARQAGHLSVSITVNGRMISLIIPDDTPPELIPVIYERLKKTDDSVYGK